MATRSPPPPGMWMTSRGQCPRGGGACECPRVGVFFQFFGGWMTSRGQCLRGGACGMSSPPPSGNPLSAPVICVKFRANQPLCPPPPLTKAFPYASDLKDSHYHKALAYLFTVRHDTVCVNLKVRSDLKNQYTLPAHTSAL